ncbi:MAG: DUF1653 domain-containing protein [Candidatus Saccharimonadales bacterium]
MGKDEFTPKPDIKKGLYRHYSGKPYEVIDVVCHSETREWLVLYKRRYEREGPELWVRPADMFVENVEYQGQQMPRFTYIGDAL